LVAITGKIARLPACLIGAEVDVMTSAPKMTAFENGAEWHPCPSVPHLLITSDQQVT
jgi:hypothetical protein